MSKVAIQNEDRRPELKLVAGTTLAAPDVEFSPAWTDLDGLYNDSDAPLEDIFDDMVARQEGDLAQPCNEAQELLDQWRLDDDTDYLPYWRAAVDRLTPGTAEGEDASEPGAGDEGDIGREEPSASNDNGDAEADGPADGDIPRVSGDADPKRQNDAEMLGVATDDFNAFLEKEATILLGEMWGARDRRNTQDEAWKPASMPWSQWIHGFDKSTEAHAWGFSRHAPSKDKAGRCMVLGSSVGGARKAKAMDTMYAMGLDVDSGVKLDSVLDKLEELGILCLVHTSYNHGKTGIALKRDEVLRKLKITGDPTMDDIRQYLHEHDKNRYEQSFIAGIEIKEQKHQTPDGVKILLDTPPMDKFRLIFPLAEPVKIIDLAESHQAALDLWEAKITGLARNTLGVHFDTACTDPSRLFYLARHPKGDTNWYSGIVRGTPLRFEDVKPMKKSSYTSNRDGDPFAAAGGAVDEGRPPLANTPKGLSLNDWHSQYKDRFEIANLLEDMCSDKIRRAGNEASGHVHIECPFEHEHSSEGGTATMAINASDGQQEYWTVFCCHDACQNRHKLQHLEEMLRAGWFDEELLFDPEEGYILDAADEDQEDERRGLLNSLLERAGTFDGNVSDQELRDLLTQAHGKIDETGKEALTKALIESTGLGRRSVNKLWKEAEKEKRKLEKLRAGSVRPEGILTTDPAPDQTQYAADAVKEANGRSPFLFEYMGQPAIVRGGRIEVLDRPGRRNALNRVTKFQMPKGDAEMQHIYPPYDVVDDLFSEDLSKLLLPLRGAVDTPFFAADGTLVTTSGYHAGAQVYLASDLELAGVSPYPTAEEARDAVRYIVEECLADFPLGGLTRQGIMEQTFTPSGVPAVANALAFILLHFARNMIHGPTPGHVVNKPQPGTGAGFLVDVCTTIRSGQPASALAMPKNKEEMSKTLIAALLDATSELFFDNINHGMDSPELAAAMTAPHTGYRARILGKTQTALVQIMSSWIFAANTLTMTDELLRRCILISLDRKAADPAKYVPEGGWRHKDVRAWAREHRATLVHCCLTIIQRWVAEGMNRSDHTLASFENWAGIMGGILDACGVGGFMGNQSDLIDLSDGTTDVLSEAIQAIADAMYRTEGARLYMGKTSAGDYQRGRIGLLDVLNGMDEPPRLDGWGWSEVRGDDGRVEYQNAQRVGQKFKQAAKGTYKVSIGGEDRSISFEGEYDSHLKKNYYSMVVS